MIANNKFRSRTPNPFTTVDNTGGETTVALGLQQQLSSDLTPSRTENRINMCTYFAFETRHGKDLNAEQNERCQLSNSVP